MLRPLLLLVGCLSLALGVLGVFLPLLPTTPFLLLSAFCFARSSQRLHTYLVNHRVLGEYINNYNNHTMTRAHKTRTIVLLWISIALSAGYLAWSGYTIPALILPLIAAGVTLHIATLRREDGRSGRPAPQPDTSPSASARDSAPDSPSAGTTDRGAAGTQ
ncbi:YbaN family protein [Corynebacterium nasicanis]|uniref:YbaN family protein n=1 Tax=Corynebacterium nasicanis TaxID=1448267 RepID=A0ABW1QE23_9CORY